MDERINKIVNGLQRLLKGVEGSFIAKVIEDNGDLVNVEDMNGVEYREVRKIATQGALGLLFTLKKDSYVVVGRLSNSDELFVTMMSEIEGVDITSGETTVKVGKEKDITFNKGMNNGLVKVDDMVGWMEKVHQDMQTLAGLLSAIAINPATMTGSVVFTPSTPFPSREKFENDKIKH